MFQVQYLKKTAQVVWRNKNGDGTTYRGSATTPDLAKAWVEEMNEKHPDLKHWVEITFCMDEVREALIALGYPPESLEPEHRLQQTFSLAIELGKIA